jgi:hypothetical protein
MTNAQALGHLQRLCDQYGQLRIITNAHRCGALVPRTPEEVERCGRYHFPLSHPKHFQVHDVVRISGPDANGVVTAHTAEGDYCMGYPPDLLPRLLEWREGEGDPGPAPDISEPEPEPEVEAAKRPWWRFW